MNKSLPNIAEYLRSLHLKISIKDLKSFDVFVDKVISMRYNSHDKLLRLDQLIISDLQDKTSSWSKYADRECTDN